MTLYKKITTLCLFAFLCLSLCSCTSKIHDNGKLKIVATNFVAFDFARSIASQNADITMLLSPGEESHSFEPTPKDIIKINEADIFIAVGGKSDEWVRRLTDTNEINKENIIFMMEIPEIKNIKEHNHEEKNGHSEFYEYDEHVWTSPENAKIIVDTLARKMIERDEENESFYSENLKTYTKELNSLDDEFSDIVNNSVRKTLVFGDRFAFRHFTDAYGLTFYSAFPGCSLETEPDAKTVKSLIDTVKRENIPVVFFKELSNAKVCDAICEATGAKKMLFHSLGTISLEDFENSESYLSIMKKNAVALKEALY